MEKTKTTVELTTNSDGSLSGSIRGKADDTLKAKKAILSALQNQTEIKVGVWSTAAVVSSLPHTFCFFFFFFFLLLFLCRLSLQISIPEGHLGMIIGKQGAKLKELQDDTATSIHVPKQGETPFVISILGTAENAKEAARRIQEMSLSEASRDRKKLPIVKAYHQLLCGADNANLKRMQEMTGATIHVPPPNKDEDGITVTGEVEAVARAVEMLTRDYERLRSSCGEVEFPVLFFLIAGARGEKGRRWRMLTIYSLLLLFFFLFFVSIHRSTASSTSM
jgi:rRNA processing protein Krr1/Pno1